MFGNKKGTMTLGIVACVIAGIDYFVEGKYLFGIIIFTFAFSFRFLVQVWKICMVPFQRDRRILRLNILE